MIHPTALISPSATLGPDVLVGPYAIIEADVQIGAGCRIEAHAQVLSGVRMGDHNTVGRAAIIGAEPQSLGFDRKVPSGVRIGSGNTFREHVTIHRSVHPGGETIVGSDNFLMAGAHLGHDVILADRTVLANHVLIAGHVVIGSRCFLGGGAVFHQFIRIGDLAMVQGGSAFSRDIPPYCTGFLLNRVEGLNTVGLRRAGFDSSARLELKRAWAEVYRSPLGPVKAAARALEEARWTEAARNFLEFVANPGAKGVAGPGRDR